MEKFTREEIEQKVCSVIAHVLGIEEGDFTLSANPHDDLGADSIDLVEIVIDLEKEFDIHINEDDLICSETLKVTDICDYVEKQIKEQAKKKRL